MKPNATANEMQSTHTSKNLATLLFIPLCIDEVNVMPLFIQECDICYKAG